MQVAVNGIVPLAADRPELDLDLNVHEFNLATFKPDWEEIRGLAGTVQVNGKLTGSPSKPSFLGQLSLSKGRLRLTNFSQGLSDVEMSAIFDAEKIHVERLDGRLGRGVVSASGEIRRGDTRSPELDVDIGFKDVRYAETDYLSLEGSGNLLIHGPLDSATVEGQVEIARGSYTQPFDWTKIVLARFGTRSVEGAKGPAWNPNFDIEINVPGNFWVRNSIVKAEMGGQARLVGTVDSPSLTGRIYATRGAFQASYGTFQIQKAYALFDETRPFFPYLFLLGECRLSGYMVRLLVSGDPDSIEFQWSSSPPLTEEQIVQLLTTGSTERAVEGSQSASAAWILSQGLRYRVSESGAGLLPVDTIELSPSRKGDRTDTEIVAGKEITDRLAVKQYVDVKDPQNIALGADYKITKRFSVSGRAERNRNYIMEVVYEILF